MSLLTSNNLLMLEKSAKFLWAKQNAHLDNISNAETPGYKVKTVTFEEKFAQQLNASLGHDHDHILVEHEGLYEDSGVQSRARMRQIIEGTGWDVWEDQETTRMDENGVNVLEQMMEAVRTAYQLQYTYQAISKDFAIVNAAMQTR